MSSEDTPESAAVERDSSYLSDKRHLMWTLPHEYLQECIAATLESKQTTKQHSILYINIYIVWNNVKLSSYFVIIFMLYSCFVLLIQQWVSLTITYTYMYTLMSTSKILRLSAIFFDKINIFSFMQCFFSSFFLSCCYDENWVWLLQFIPKLLFLKQPSWCLRSPWRLLRWLQWLQWLNWLQWLKWLKWLQWLQWLILCRWQQHPSRRWWTSRPFSWWGPTVQGSTCGLQGLSQWFSHRRPFLISQWGSFHNYSSNTV